MHYFQIQGRLKILVVEDNLGDFVLLKDYIQLSAWPDAEIVLRNTMESAIEYLADNQCHIVFLDLYLPDSSGLESFSRLKETRTAAVVIILSGLPDMKTALEAISSGADDYLTKGEFDEVLIEKTITYSIERKRNLEKLRQANERYGLVTKATHDLIWDWDLSTGEIYRDEQSVKTVYGVDGASIADLSDVAHTITARAMPSSPSSRSRNSRTSRPRSPISATTDTSALVCLAICDISTDLPTPGPAKMPIRWPRPQVCSASIARMLVLIG